MSEDGVMPQMRLDNAREPEQLRKMQELAQNGECHFCRAGFEAKHKAPIIHEDRYWFITANDFPYKGSVHHYLIVPKGHITKISDIPTIDRLALFEAIEWLEGELSVTGESIFVRSGNMAYTGATLDHLHFHFLVGAEKTSEMTFDDNLMVTLGYKQK